MKFEEYFTKPFWILNLEQSFYKALHNTKLFLGFVCANETF